MDLDVDSSSPIGENPEITKRDGFFHDFRTALASHLAVFTIGGTVKPSKPVTIRWDSDDCGTAKGCKVSLPVTDDGAQDSASFETLVKDCDPATFGRREEEVFDEDYRKAGKMDTDAFCTDFNPYEYGIMDTTMQALANTIDGYGVGNCRGLRAELYKLNVYSSPSGKFKPHVDTPRSDEQMGSLVVYLPHPHKGGQLAVRHQGREVIYDWGSPIGPETHNVSWAAFFSDCEHEVLEVTEGHRVTLTYNLYWSSHGPSAMATYNNALDLRRLPFYKPLLGLRNSTPYLPRGGMIAFTCTHSYPHTSNSATNNLPAGLKGLDMIMYQTLRKIFDHAVVTAVLDDGPREKRVRDRGCWMDESDSESADPSEMKYATRNAFISDRVRSPIAWEGFDDDDQPPDPASLGGCADGYFQAYFPQRKVVWLNHLPGHHDPSEVAVTYLTYGNQPGLGTYYSSAVIAVNIPPLKDVEMEVGKVED